MTFFKCNRWAGALAAYVVVLLYLTVLSREPDKVNIVYLDLFWGYDDPQHFKEKLLNIAIFIPVGLLAGFLFKRHRVLLALLIGLMVSLAIECSQLAWSRGEFDVDDLLNNTLGAMIGVAVWWVCRTACPSASGGSARGDAFRGGCGSRGHRNGARAKCLGGILPHLRGRCSAASS